MTSTLRLLTTSVWRWKWRVSFALACTGISALLLPFMLSEVAAEQQIASEPRWQIYAGCAAAYLANWQTRQSDRSQDMSSMIKEQYEDYKNKAVSFYQEDLKSTPGEAAQMVEALVSSNTGRFVAMEKAGTLEAFIDKCPPD
jgi:hypothetical protein